MRRFVVTALFVSQVAAGAMTLAYGQSFSPVELRGSEVHEFRSRDGTLFEVFVAFPLGYDPSGETQYPVLYITDAALVFPLVTQTYRFLARYQEAPPALLVGVDRPTSSEDETMASRFLDLTPTPVPSVERSYGSRYGQEVRSGGADAFLSVLNNEIISWVEARWPVSAERGLFGYSLGGLFVTHVLLTSPGSFSCYFIGSPSLWWDGGVMFEREQAFADRAEDLPARVFLSAGTEESSSMLLNTVKLVETLKSRDYDSLDLEFQFLQGETHVSGIPGAFSRAIRALYGGN